MKGSAANSNSNSGSKSRPSKQKLKLKQERPLNVFKRQQQWPKKGCLVEVTSDEEGIKGAWYVATLLHFPSSSPSKSASSEYHKEKKVRQHRHQAYVEYHSLLAEEGSSEPLREYVNVEFVRPLPPRQKFPEPFQLGHVVDAYFRDGWWTGVITGILHQGLRFVVTFQNPPDELDFGLSELRFHRQWVNCKWVRPDKQRTAGLMFSAGKRVEVSFDRTDGCIAWFPATVLEDTGNDCYLVEYETPFEGGAAQRVKVSVDSAHVRPCPPRLNDNGFSLLGKVDAFFDFGWWSGVITKELADYHYVVYFKPLNKEAEFSRTELRLQMEWKQGNWFITSQGGLNPSDYQKHEDLVGMSANTTEITVPPSDTFFKENNSKEKLTSPLNLNDVDPSHCNQESPKVTTAVNSLSTSTIVAVDKAKICENDTPSSVAMGYSLSNQSLGGDLSDSHTWGKRFKRKHKKIHEDDTLSSGRTNLNLKKLQVKSPSSSVGGREGNALEVAYEGLQEGHITMQTNLPVVLGLECDKSSNSTAKKPSHSSGEELLRHVVVQGGLNDNASPRIKDDDQLDSQEKLKKRRGRPRKVERKSSVTSPESLTKDAIMEELVKDFMMRDNDSLKDVEIKSANIDFSLPSKEFAINGSGKKLIVEQEKHEKESNTIARSKLRKSSETAVEVSIKQLDRRLSKRGRRRTVNVNIVSQVQDSLHASIGKMSESNCIAEEVEILNEELPAKAFEDQPLSKWFQEMQSPSINGASKVSPRRNVEPSAVVASNGQQQVGEESAAAADADKNKISGNEPEILPFVKNTLLWSTLESMEVFRKMPQKPHFRPLAQHKESCREGLAIGCMVNFSSVVERTSKLNFDEPKSAIDDMLETLVELEEHGFNVEVIRERITDLLTKRQKQEKLQEELEQVNGEIEKQNLESAKIDEEIDEIQKQIVSLQEKHSEAVAKKESKKREVAALVSKLEGIKEGIESVERNFQGSTTTRYFWV